MWCWKTSAWWAHAMFSVRPAVPRRVKWWLLTGSVLWDLTSSICSSGCIWMFLHYFIDLHFTKMHMNSAFTPAQIFTWHQCPSPQLQLSFHSFLLFCCLSSKNNGPWLLFTNIVQTWLSYPSTWPTVRLLEKHGFLPANQQRSGCATDTDIFASDQSIMAWSISNFSVFTGFGKFEFFAPNLLPHLWSSHQNYQW